VRAGGYISFRIKRIRKDGIAVETGMGLERMSLFRFVWGCLGEKNGNSESKYNILKYKSI